MSKLLNRLKAQRDNLSSIPQGVVKFSAVFLPLSRYILAVMALIAGVTIIAEYGFYLPRAWSLLGNSIRMVIIDAYFFLWVIRILVVDKKKAYLLNHRGEFLLMLFLGLYILFPGLVLDIAYYINPKLTPVAVANIYLVTTQVFLLLTLLFNWVLFGSRLTTYKIHPPALLIISFLFLILLGTGMLLVPKATVASGISFIDALFTSTSAVCVTGLIVVDTGSHFTFTGQLVILFLIQLGGLGIMTLTTFIAFLFSNSSELKEYATLREMLDEETTGKIKRTVILIVVMTFIIEAAGALLIYHSLDGTPYTNMKDRIYFSIFHSVSAFCNAGFSLEQQGLAVPYLSVNAVFLSTIMLLIVAGGLGFPVLSNLGSFLIPKKKKAGAKLKRLTLHSKIVLSTTAILLFSGAVSFYILEYNNSLAPQDEFSVFLHAAFQSVTLRTAGFNTLDFSAFTAPTYFMMIFFMWIGASPASTGGGIKTTTFTVAILNLISLGRGRKYVELDGREISGNSIIKAFATIILSVFFIGGAVFVLLITDPAIPLMPLIFEVVSAFSTVGLSAGITSSLSPEGRIVIVILMFIGRIGLLTILFTLFRQQSRGNYRYSVENILI